ncbi:hypothetical protein BD410DRAFT_854759 [Rickenella mellea]|uniref:Fungal calcium binding protein domain-containing protein n=1 Tax=Rickenella mellea TaxID=50990 RepID=A0A4Y7PLB2_9AGAM|nr:hypothetical protein BD410DRAFT_854759 [Rickenella mellea]
MRGKQTSPPGLYSTLRTADNSSLPLFTMKFTIIAVLAAVASTVTASPAIGKRSCHAFKCVAALAPAVVSCAAAAAEDGANAAEDISNPVRIISASFKAFPLSISIIAFCLQRLLLNKSWRMFHKSRSLSTFQFP